RSPLPHNRIKKDKNKQGVALCFRIYTSTISVSHPLMSSSEANKVICGTPRRSYNDPKYLTQKKLVKDLETYQEAVLVGLLNSFCSFTISRPRKQCSVALSSAKIKSIHFPTETIEISKLADEKFKPIYEEELRKGVAKPTAFRRYEKNKRIFIHNLLFDIALELGFFFDSKLSRKSAKTYSIERIERIYYMGKLVFSLDQMVVKGSMINSYLYDLVSFGMSQTIPVFDDGVQGLLNEQSKHQQPVTL
ncbi:hypothetical protein EIN_313260, partial [Entamoeba invadens IP1]